MFNVGSQELLVIFLVVLLLFGANRIPEIARSFGQGMRDLKKAVAGIEDELKLELDDRPSRPRAVRPESTGTRRPRLETPASDRPGPEAPASSASGVAALPSNASGPGAPATGATGAEAPTSASATATPQVAEGGRPRGWVGSRRTVPEGTAPAPTPPEVRGEPPDSPR